MPTSAATITPSSQGDGAGRTTYTSYNMTTLESISSQQLPAQIQPSQGPPLRRIG